MKQQFDATLTGTDNSIEGTVQYISCPGFTHAYEFKSLDGTLHLIIGRETNGQWTRIDGTEPYFSSWVEELAEQLAGSKTL